MKGRAIMVSDPEMEDFARECVDLANLTADPQMRERFFQMAREWMAIAMHPSEDVRTEIDVKIPPQIGRLPPDRPSGR